MKLSEYMRLHSLSPEALSALVGNVSASAVRKWANDERVPRRDQMEKLAEITAGKVMPNDFFDVGAFAETDGASAPDADDPDHAGQHAACDPRRHGNDAAAGFHREVAS